MPIDHLDWEYDPHDDTRLTAKALLLMLTAALVFWTIVIGGGVWLANHNPVTIQEDTTP